MSIHLVAAGPPRRWISSLTVNFPWEGQNHVVVIGNTVVLQLPSHPKNGGFLTGIHVLFGHFTLELQFDLYKPFLPHAGGHGKHKTYV